MLSTRGWASWMVLVVTFGGCGSTRLVSDPSADAGGPGEVDAGADAGQVEAPMCRPPEDHESTWLACTDGCLACAEILAPFDRYFTNHPACRPGHTCGVVGNVCGSACPMPTPDDVSCTPKAGGWMGCRGSGCNVDLALIETIAPTYFSDHPWCNGATSIDGPLVPCSDICPAPTPADQIACDGTPGQWEGCRGYGCWVCAELIKDFPRYLQNHPACTANVTCHGNYFTCNEVCPAPGPGDK